MTTTTIFRYGSSRLGLLSLIALVWSVRLAVAQATLAHQLYWHVIRTYNVEIAPKRPPDLATAAVLYQGQCTACHGLQGQGDGPASANLDPAPSNFHDRQRMDQRSIYGFYRTMTLG